MSKKKMNGLIACAILALYLICLWISYSTCQAVEAERFTRVSAPYIEALSGCIHDIQVNSEFAADSMSELERQLFDTGDCLYPYTYAVLEKNGSIVLESGTSAVLNKDGDIVLESGTDVVLEQNVGTVLESGTAIVFEGEEEKVCNIEPYFTDDLKQQYAAFTKSSMSAVDELTYYEDGETFIPVTMHLQSIVDHEQEGEVTLQLSDETINKIYKYQNEESARVYLYVRNSQRCDNRMYQKLRAQLRDELQSEEIRRYVADEFFYPVGGGYYGSDRANCYDVFELDGKSYFFHAAVAHDLVYDTLTSPEFGNNFLMQTVLFGLVSVAAFVIANKLYEKNRVMNETREAFTSGVAHELKTPITIINNHCECLMQDIAPEKREEYVAAIYQQNRHLSKLVSNLLQYNRISAANAVWTDFPLSDVVETELEKYEALMEQKGIHPEADLRDMTIHGDKELLTLVVDNFLSNAVKHTPAGGKIIVTLADKGKFSVYNEGDSIPEEQRNSVWEILTRSQNEDDSTGMGLAICKKILEIHHFKYGFENKENGVVFYFTQR